MNDLMMAFDEARFGKQAVDLPSKGTLAKSLTAATTVEEVDALSAWLDRYHDKIRAVAKQGGGKLPDGLLEAAEDIPGARQMIQQRRQAIISSPAVPAAEAAKATKTPKTPKAPKTPKIPKGVPAASEIIDDLSEGSPLRSARATKPGAPDWHRGRTQDQVEGILERSASKAKPPARLARPAATTRMGEFFRSPKKALRSLVSKGKLGRIAKGLGPVALAAGIPALGYLGLKGLGSLTSSKAAADDGDSRGMLTRIADHFAMSKLTPEKRETRDEVEQMIRDEARLRAKAKKHILAARDRAREPASTGGFSWIEDVARSIVPGLAPTAAPKDDGIVKGAEEGPSGLGTLAHLGTLGAGAGLGAGIQSGAFGGRRAAQLAMPHMPDKLKAALGAMAEESTESPEVRRRLTKYLRELATNTEDVALLGQPKGMLSKTRGLFEPASDLVTSGTLKSKRPHLMRQLEGVLPNKAVRGGFLTKLRAMVGGAAGKVKPGWKLGAGVGAAAATLPFVLWNLMRARRVRTQGGPAAFAERGRAEKLLAEAMQVQTKRKAMLPQLA
jgi:hypothetical protein